MSDFLRIATASPEVAVGNVEKNVKNILSKAYEADKNGSQIIVFPELCITGYSCGDLFFQRTVLDEAKKGLKEIIEKSNGMDAILAVGLPVDVKGKLYNAAAIIKSGVLYGLIPKTFIPTYNEFYERRWFSSGAELKENTVSCTSLGISDIQATPVPIGNDLVFDAGFFRFGAEVCEDIWAAISPSAILSLNGAEVILNLSASNEIISKRNYRRTLVSQHSAAQLCIYAYSSSSCSESTTDLIFSGHSMICENGRIIAENEKTIDGDYVLYADADLGKIRTDRLKIKTFSECYAVYGSDRAVREIAVPCAQRANDLRYLTIAKLPFVPGSKKDRAERCMEIFEMQVMGLKKRMDVTHARPVIGVSGGLDSTLALLVCAEAVKRSGRPLTDVVGITMPCFGTTDRTYNNSVALMQKLGVTYLEIPIKEAVIQHFKDIGQDKDKFDLTFENSQARERTQVLMDYAGRVGGLVVGTGDLSELALGWCTYNADHMSMYGVNCGIPKTLVRWMIDVIKETDSFVASKEVLSDILDTPISPELLPPDANGKIAQQTEEIVGPYALHDFFLYYTVRFGFTPEKIYLLANKAFEKDFDKATVKKWLVTFYRRFFSQQFKRSCLPDGVKIGSICLSPRGDWRMPSDADGGDFVKRAESLPE